MAEFGQAGQDVELALGDPDALDFAHDRGAHFAQHLPQLSWQPTDLAEHLAALTARVGVAGKCNLLPPLELDVSSPVWPVAHTEAAVAINLIHIAPVTVLAGLMAGAGRLLTPGGVLYIYGPFKEDGRHTAPSNAAFDASLKAYDPAWGVRDLGDVCAIADRHRLDLIERVAMPANNLSLVFAARAR